MVIPAQHDNRFHQARIRRGLSIADIAALTRIPPRFIENIDEASFDRLPSGLYARAYVRAFAVSVGLDPTAAVDSVLDVLPREIDAVAALGNTRQTAPRMSEQTQASKRDNIPGPRYAAAACDGVILFASSTALVVLIAVVCGTTVGGLLDVAPGATGVLCGFMSAAYFVILGGVDGRTPGAWLCHLPRTHPAAPLNLSTVARRGALVSLEEASIVVDLVLRFDPQSLRAFVLRRVTRS